jgi:hypothetical protein
LAKSLRNALKYSTRSPSQYSTTEMPVYVRKPHER